MPILTSIVKCSQLSGLVHEQCFDFLAFQVLKNVGFEFPIFLTFIHYVVSWVLMAILNIFSILPASPPSKSSRLTSLFTLGVVMSLSTGLANVSLKYNRWEWFLYSHRYNLCWWCTVCDSCVPFSVGFYQMSKIAVTPSIVLAEFIFYDKRVSFLKVIVSSKHKASHPCIYANYMPEYKF